MQAELENKSIELLNWLETAIKATADFSAQQVPLFIQELLAYNFVISLIWFIIGILLILAGAYALYSVVYGKLAKLDWTNTRDGFIFSKGILALVMVVIGVSAGAPIACDNTDWIKIKLAPRVYLMEYARDLIKK